MSWESNIALEVLEEFAGNQSHVEDRAIDSIGYHKTAQAKWDARRDRREYDKARFQRLKTNHRWYLKRLKRARKWNRAAAAQRRALERELDRLIPTRKKKKPTLTRNQEAKKAIAKSAADRTAKRRSA